VAHQDANTTDRMEASVGLWKRWFLIPIHRRIIVGMVVGVVLGFLVGPRSVVLSRDLLMIPDAARSQVHRRPNGPLVTLSAPGRVRVVGRRKVEGHLWYRIAWHSDGVGHSGWFDASLATEPISSVGRSIMAWIRPVGAIFLRLLKMIVVPLVFASLLVGVYSLGDSKRLGRLGGKTLLYYLATTAVAISIGLVLVNVVRPGRFVPSSDRKMLLASSASHPAFKSSQGSATAHRGHRGDRKMVAPAGDAGRGGGQGAKGDGHGSAQTGGSVHLRTAGKSLSRWLVEIVPKNPIAAAAKGNMLQVIFFALFLGIVLRKVPGSGPDRFVDLMITFDHAMVRAVGLIMETAPFAVAALLADVVGTTGMSVVLALGIYSLVVLVGLVLQGVLTYGAAVAWLGRMSPIRFLRLVRPVQLMAFSTASSAATLPVTMECAENDLGVSQPISSFVLPLGATMNMDGTALYQAVAAVFIAQVFGIHLSLVQQLSVLAAALLASIGAAAVPGAGIVLLAMVLETVGLPVAGIALVLGVDRLLDMFRTAVNVTGDLSAAVVLARSEGESLAGSRDTSSST